MQLVRFVRVALAARTVQDFLWGGPPGRSNRPGEQNGKTWDCYLDACQKRLVYLRALDRNNPSWEVEARKRLLQLATIAVSAMELIDGGYVK
jgi:hypothetical protein